MKTVYIYLRAVVHQEKNRLSLFDSNRNSAIDDLHTFVSPGSVIVWKPDCHSGIQSITRIASKTGKGNIFTKNPVKKIFGNCFVMRVPPNAEGEEAYLIEYTLQNGKQIIIDPYIHIKPPQP